MYRILLLCCLSFTYCVYSMDHTKPQFDKKQLSGYLDTKKIHLQINYYKTLLFSCSIIKDKASLIEHSEKIKSLIDYEQKRIVVLKKLKLFELATQLETIVNHFILLQNYTKKHYQPVSQINTPILQVSTLPLQDDRSSIHEMSFHTSQEDNKCSNVKHTNSIKPHKKKDNRNSSVKHISAHKPKSIKKNETSFVALPVVSATAVASIVSYLFYKKYQPAVRKIRENKLHLS